MKVVQVTPEFPPPLIGGGGYHVYNLTRELVRRGVDVTVFTLKIGNTFLFKRAEVGTQFNGVKVFRVPASYISAISAIAYPLVPRLIPLLLKESPDIIHAHGYPFVTSDAALAVSKIKKIPMILTLHGFPGGFNKLAHRAYFNLIGKETLKEAGKIIAVSTAVAREFKVIGVSEEKMVIIPNGVDLEEYRCLPKKRILRERLNIKEDRKIMLAIGRLERIKGFQYIIEALPRILETVSVQLIIAGPEFNYGAQLRRFVKERKVEDHVVFYGPMDQREKLEALAAADAIVVPSIYEGFGIVLLEAMAAGKPTVATRTGIAPEIVQEGMNGILVNPGDTKDLAEKLIKLLSDNQLSSLMGHEARKTANAFDWKKIAVQTKEIYQQCLKCPRK